MIYSLGPPPPPPTRRLPLTKQYVEKAKVQEMLDRDIIAPCH